MKLNKRIYITVYFSILLFVFITSSCKYHLIDGFYREDNIRERIEPIQTLTDVDAPDTNNNSVYSAVIITDIHFGADKSRKDEEFLKWFRAQCEQEDETLRPRFLVSLGDSVEYGTRKVYKEYVEFCEKIEEIANEVYQNDNFKVYNVVGNHDLYNGGWDNYLKLLNPHTSYYRFTTKSSESETGFAWYFLDSANGSLGRKQLKDFKKNAIKDKSPKIVLTHYPVYSNDVLYFTLQNTEERDILLDVFSKSKVKLLLHGHHHPGSYYDFGKFKEEGIKGYLDNSYCAVVTVDEKAGTCVSKSYKFTK